MLTTIFIIFFTIYAIIRKIHFNHLDKVRRKQKWEQELRLRAAADKLLANNGKAISPAMFLRLKKLGRLQDFSGCYVIYNITKDKYYVGQSINVIARVANHLQGRGNSDVYFDLRNGDEFNVSAINIKNTQFKTLNSLEKELINDYNAYKKGYNKTCGNRG